MSTSQELAIQQALDDGNPNRAVPGSASALPGAASPAVRLSRMAENREQRQKRGWLGAGLSAAAIVGGASLVGALTIFLPMFLLGAGGAGLLLASAFLEQRRNASWLSTHAEAIVLARGAEERSELQGTEGLSNSDRARLAAIREIDQLEASTTGVASASLRRKAESLDANATERDAFFDRDN